MKPTEEGGARLVVADEGEVLRFSHAAMATVFEILCVHEDRTYAGQAAQAAFAQLDRLELEQSRFVANSDVSRVSALGAGEATRVSPSTMECLQIAWTMHQRTGGAFDVSIGTGLDRLELVPDEFVVHALAEGARLDLGGIGKGYAVDRMAESLEEWGIACALLHGGQSSVLAGEPPPGREGWPLTLSAPSPGDERVLVRLVTRRQALSASGTRKGEHIRDPRSGEPVQDRAAWVALACARRPAGSACRERWPEIERSPSAVAEALSTAFMVLATEEVAEVCRQCPGLEAWIAPRTSVTEGPSSLVHFVGPPGEGR
jgi:thiamine biosynthesis lipoprotein